jgi:VanZ family protein
MFRSAILKAFIHAWIPVILLMGTIYVLSAQPKFAPPAPTTDVYFSGVIPVFPGSWDTLIKKTEHMLIYGLLALLNLRALMLLKVPIQTAYYAALVLTLTFALTDELHQRFVMGRSASGTDIVIDFFGALIALLAARQLYNLRQTQHSVSMR